MDGGLNERQRAEGDKRWPFTYHHRDTPIAHPHTLHPFIHLPTYIHPPTYLDLRRIEPIQRLRAGGLQVQHQDVVVVEVHVLLLLVHRAVCIIVNVVERIRGGTSGQLVPRMEGVSQTRDERLTTSTHSAAAANFLAEVGRLRPLHWSDISQELVPLPTTPGTLQRPQ